MPSKLNLVIIATILNQVVAFVPSFGLVRKTASRTRPASSLYIFGNSEEDERVISQLMDAQALTREEAEKEYKKFKINPNDYALEKGEEYYSGLGYKSLMEGVVAEAEKEGRGDEVRERIGEIRRGPAGAKRQQHINLAIQGYSSLRSSYKAPTHIINNLPFVASLLASRSSSSQRSSSANRSSRRTLSLEP